MGMEIMNYIKDCTTARDAWSTLKENFDQTGLERTVPLLVELIKIKHPSQESMQAYLVKIKTVANKLNLEDSVHINERMHIEIFVSQLPERLESVKQAMYIMDKLELSYVINTPEC